LGTVRVGQIGILASLSLRICFSVRAKVSVERECDRGAAMPLRWQQHERRREEVV
jgi:hypothetical protein